MSGFVYAVVSGDAVKIGYSTNPHRRMTKVRSDNSSAILLGVIPATKKQEKELHQRLRQWRISGEWFRRGNEAVEFLLSQMQKIEPHRFRLRRKKKHPSGNALCAYLELRQIRAGAFAKRIGVSQSTISRILSGRNAPSFNVLRSIARETDGEVTANDLVGLPSRIDAA